MQHFKLSYWEISYVFYQNKKEVRKKAIWASLRNHSYCYWLQWEPKPSSAPQKLEELRDKESNLSFQRKLPSQVC